MTERDEPGSVPYRRRWRYYKYRIPGDGAILNEIDRGRDAPLTRRDAWLLAAYVVGIVVVGAIVAVLVAYVF